MNFLKRYKSVLTPDQRKERKKLLILSLLSGLLIGISFPPIPLPYLMFGALIPYFIVIDSKKTLGEINRFTYAFAFVFTIISIYWVGSWTSEADPFLMISGAMLMFYNPLMLLIPSTLFYFTKKKFGDKIPFLLFPFFWVSYEYFYSVFELRFPWLTLGHGQAYFKSFIQIADIYRNQGFMPEAEAAAGLAQSKAIECTDETAIMQAVKMRGIIAYYRGDNKASEECFIFALGLAERLGDKKIHPSPRFTFYCNVLGYLRRQVTIKQK